MLNIKFEYKTFLAYTNFIFNYGFKFFLKIIFYNLKYKNYYKDHTPKHIPNNNLSIKNYDKEKVTGYSPTYYYYLNLTKLFLKEKILNLIICMILDLVLVGSYILYNF